MPEISAPESAIAESAIAASSLRTEHSRQRAGAVREALHRRPEGIQERHVQIRQRRIFRIFAMLARVDPPAAAPAHNDRQLVRAMAVAVAQGRAEEDHRIVEYGRLAFLHRAELA